MKNFKALLVFKTTIYTKYLALLIVALMSETVSSQESSWLSTIGGFGFDQGVAIDLDQSGNVYTMGTFHEDAVMNSPSGTVALGSAGEYNIFISKHNAEGELLWVANFGGNTTVWPESLTVDENGSVYLIGGFIDTIDFNPGPEVFELVASNSSTFILKLDTNGGFIWAKALTNRIGGHSIIIDNSGDLIIAGRFRGTVDFDPGNDVFELMSVNFGFDDIFVLKLNSDGNFVWARKMGGAQMDFAYRLGTDMYGNIFVYGSFAGVANFHENPDGYLMDSSNGGKRFIVKLNSDGNHLWAKQFPGEEGYGLAVDPQGNVYLSASFYDTIVLNPGAEEIIMTPTVQAQLNTFIMKLNTFGNFLWAKNTESQAIFDLASDDIGNVYVTGNFILTLEFETPEEQVSLTSAGSYDIFVLKMDSNGVYHWATRAGGNSLDGGMAIACDNAGGVYITGGYYLIASFGDDEMIDFIAGNNNAFIWKLQDNGFTNIENIRDNVTRSLFPNPTSDKFVLELNEGNHNVDISIRNILGQLIFSRSFVNERRIELSLDGAKGLYLLEVVTDQGNREHLKVIKR